MLLVTFYTRHLGHCLATTKSTFKQFVFKLNVNVRNLKAQWISQIFSAINIRCNNIHDCILNMSDLHYPSLSMFITTLNFPLYFSFLFMFATLLALLGIKIANFRVTGNVAQLYLSLIYTKIRDIANRAIYSRSFETPNLS